MRPDTPPFSPTRFLRECAPDFCWVSYRDLLLMAEQVFENVNENSLKQMLNRMAKRGEFFSRPSPLVARGRAKLYLRRPA